MNDYIKQMEVLNLKVVNVDLYRLSCDIKYNSVLSMGWIIQVMFHR